MSVPEPVPRSIGPSDAALVVAARAGEVWASESLYRRHIHVVHGLTCRLFGRDSDVDDVVQETFIDALSSLDRLEEPGAFRSWVCGIAVRKICKLIRRRRLLTRLGLRRPEDPPEIGRMMAKTAPPDVVSELRSVYQAIQGLPAELRVTFLLRRVEGANLDEIASMTETSLATVKRRLVKAAEMLGSVVSPGENEP